MKFCSAILGLLFGVILFLAGLDCLIYLEDAKTIGMFTTITGYILSTLGLIVISRVE